MPVPCAGASRRVPSTLVPRRQRLPTLPSYRLSGATPAPPSMLGHTRRDRPEGWGAARRGRARRRGVTA
ncbi:Hypothetical protein SCLAV_5072 [Streptomyces clavuligerus]|uniref:Uncharacterized protein n=1 Tax=Streptomyces clavuligerus TaxID=1901 RepID=E2PX68_STRCL|nr:Hypothetical protein SCLAV_5072 [Streptomyces clavuligerus]